MKRVAISAILLSCLFMAATAEAGVLRPASWNYTMMGIGGVGLAFGVAALLATSVACPPLLAAATLIGSAVAVGVGAADELHEVFRDKTPRSSFAAELDSDELKAWEESVKQIENQLDDEARSWSSGGNAHGRRSGIGSRLGDLFGSKSANAGELESLSSIDQFIAENSEDKIRLRDKGRRKQNVAVPKQERKGKSQASPKQTGEISPQPDIHDLNLDDPNGDWCKCAEPGCSANMDDKTGLVIFGCTKCKKVNVKYARMALELEQRMKAAGETPTWYGENAEALAHGAAESK